MGNSLISSGSKRVISPMAAQFITETIGKDRVVIFSKSHCPYCTMAKEQFKKINVKYLSLEIEDRPDCQELQDALENMTGARSVPRVFIDGNFVGGGTDIKKLYETGQLQKMLA